jgi:hypothetical protein
VRLRPYLGVGAMVSQISTSLLGEETSVSHTSLALWPGMTMSYDLKNSPDFVGGDARILLNAETGSASLGLMANVGVRF